MARETTLLFYVIWSNEDSKKLAKETSQAEEKNVLEKEKRQKTPPSKSDV